MNSDFSNPYMDQIANTLPRVLSLFDVNRTRDTFGYGDRYYWSWKLIDFSNGTFQGVAHGLARLLRDDLVPDYSSTEEITSLIDAVFAGTQRMMRRDGSMEEAFPYESSFCVTALVAFDLLVAIDLLGDSIPVETAQRYQRTVEPLIEFMKRSDETHGIISNHLATAVAALHRWGACMDDVSAREKGDLLLERILEYQSEEGWYREYSGADPGYQTLCTHYLADVYHTTESERLLDSLRKSLRFLIYCAHPDGSFGGHYGSRNTHFMYPSGLEYLSSVIPEAEALGEFCRKGIPAFRHVTLMAMDEPNLIPMFNSYCWAAAEVKSRDAGRAAARCQLPFERFQEKPHRSYFPQAGLLVDVRADCYTIVNLAKGGVVYQFSNSPGESISSEIDCGVLIRHRNGKVSSTQHIAEETEVTIEDDLITVRHSFAGIELPNITPFRFTVFRFISITCFRFPLLRRIIKDFLINHIVYRKPDCQGENLRRVSFGEACLSISDSWSGIEGTREDVGSAGFSAIHMASEGYWQNNVGSNLK